VALQALCLFALHVLLPNNIMAKQCRCLLLLKYILDGLMPKSDCDPSPQRSLIEKMIDEHQDLFLALYGAKYAKIKFHWLWHVLDALVKFRMALDCFKPERMHHLTKTFALHQTGHRLSDTCVLARWVLSIVGDIAEPQTYEVCFLTGKVADSPEFYSAVCSVDPDIGSKVTSSTSMHCAFGTLRQGAIVIVTVVQYINTYYMKNKCLFKLRITYLHSNELEMTC